MNSFFSRLLPLAALALLAASCNLINPPERTPTYLHIDSISFVNSPVIGSASQRIGHALLYYQNQALGTFDLPCTVPVLTEPGGGTVQILPGVDLNGLIGRTVDYPFFQGDTIHIDHNPGNIVTIQPKVHYTPSTRLIWSDEFDGSTQFVHYSSANPADSLRVTTQPGEVFEGTGSGKFHLSAGANYALSATPYYVSIPLVPTNDSYIELNYRGTARLVVGLATTTQSGPAIDTFIGFKPRATWNKVYIQTRTFVGQHIGSNYNIILGVGQPEGSNDGGDVFVDNLKVLSF